MEIICLKDETNGWLVRAQPYLFPIAQAQIKMSVLTYAADTHQDSCKQSGWQCGY